MLSEQPIDIGTVARVIKALLKKHKTGVAIHRDVLKTSLHKYFRQKLPDVLFERALEQATNLEQSDAVSLQTRKRETAIERLLSKGIKYKTRIAPCPSNYATIGHYKGFFWNHYFASQSGGTLVLRFDDTNPSHNYKQEYYESFLTLAKENEFTCVVEKASANIEQYMRACRALIDKGKCYVCYCHYSSLDSQCGPDCRARNTQLHFNRMCEEKTGALRYSSSQQSFVIMRTKINAQKAVVFAPTLVLQGVVDDYRSGINLILRGRDLESLTLRQKELYETLYDCKYPPVLYWGRVRFYDSRSNTQFPSSKRHINSEENPLLALPFYHSFRNMGVSIAVLKKVFKELGFTKNDVSIDINLFYNQHTKGPEIKASQAPDSKAYTVVSLNAPFTRTISTMPILNQSYCYDPDTNTRFYCKNTTLYETWFKKSLAK